MLLLKIGFNIYGALIEKKTYFYMVWFVQVPLLVKPAVFDISGHWILNPLGLSLVSHRHSDRG